MLSFQVQFSPVAAAAFGASLAFGFDSVTAGVFAALAHIARDYVAQAFTLLRPAQG